MLNLREKTGCFLFYLIEGSPFHSPNRRFAGIEFKNLQAHLDHCQLRDQISVIFCKSIDGVLPRIFALMDNYKTFLPSKVGGAGQRHLLKEKLVQTDDMVLIDLWCCLFWINVKTAHLLVSNNITIAKVYLAEVSKDDIAKLQYENGRVIGEKRANDLIEGVNGKETTILSRIKGLSKASAEIILKKYDFQSILNGSATVADLAEIQLNSRRLGEKLAEKIAKYLTIKNELIIA